MVLRRSSRSASAKPPSAAAKPLSKSVSNPRTNGTKRPASAEPSMAPLPKRSRSVPQKPENDPPVAVTRSKPNSKSGLAEDSAKPTTKKSRKLSPIHEAPPAPKQLKPYFNPLPVPPQKKRPGLQPFVWGTGNFGQFGMGPDVLGEVSKPKRNTWIEEHIKTGSFGEDNAGIESVACGGLHTIFLDERGTLWSCGVNDDAALGRVTKDVPDPENPSAFLSVDELTSIPHPLQTLVDEGFRAVKVVAGDSICAAVSDQGELRVWGSFRVDEGSLGFSDGLKHQFLPTLPTLELNHKPGDIEKISSIASGGNHLLVLTTHGNVYSWGAGDQSQLGRRVIARRKIHGTVPEKITLGTRGRKAVIIGAGAYHSFAVDEAGDIWGWGLNSMGQIGTGYKSSEDSVVQLPKKVQRLSKKELDGDVVVQIDGGSHHSVFLLASGKVYACGRFNGGQLGLADDDVAFKDRSDPESEFLAEPALVTFPDPNDPVIQISCGAHNNAAVTRGGALYCWGQGVQSELGLGDEEEARTPRVVVRKEGGSWFAAAAECGGQHTIGLFRKK